MIYKIVPDKTNEDSPLLNNARHRLANLKDRYGENIKFVSPIEVEIDAELDEKEVMQVWANFNEYPLVPNGTSIDSPLLQDRASRWQRLKDKFGDVVIRCHKPNMVSTSKELTPDEQAEVIKIWCESEIDKLKERIEKLEKVK